MAKDLYQNTKEREKKDSKERRRRNKKRKNDIIGLALLGLMLAACGAPSEGVEENPGRLEDFDSGNDFDTGKLSGKGDIKEEPKAWPKEHGSCGVQELGGYLHEYNCASPYASAEIAITDYEGEKLETEWNAPSAFRFSGEADVTWRYYNSLTEMEVELKEAGRQERDAKAHHFLYYTFPMTKNDHALDLYYTLQEKFDAKEHPLTAWSADNGKLFYYMQETLEEKDGYELAYLNSRNSRVNLYMKDRTAYGLTLVNAPSEGDDETLE